MTAGLFFCPESQKSETRTLGRAIECAGGLWGCFGLFLLWKPHRGRWILGAVFGRSASWRRLMILIYFMYGQPYDDGQPK